MITIDGPVGAGKSTVARLVAGRLGWDYVTTGSLYRTCALIMDERGMSLPAPEAQLADLASWLDANYRQDAVSGCVFLAEREVTSRLRSPEMSERASRISQDARVRAVLLPLQRKLAQTGRGAVVDGRDMGTVVFPEAPLKIFLTASAESRAARRSQELGLTGGNEEDRNRLEREIAQRDARDMGREVAPLRAAEDAYSIDSTLLTIPEVVERILETARKRGLCEEQEAQGGK